MKVLSIHWGFSLGGVGKYAQLIDQVRRYAPLQVASLCILGKNWWHDAAGLDNITASRIYITSRFDLSWIRKVAYKIDQCSPDLIMTHGFNGHFVALATRLFARKKPVLLCSYHGQYHAPTRGRTILEKIFDGFTAAYIRYMASGCVAVAEFTKKQLVQKGVPPFKIQVVHNGIQDDQPAPCLGSSLRREWGINDREILVGAASRLDPVKGIEFLVEAFVILCKRHSNLRLVIIGSGTSEQRLRSKVAESGLSGKVTFTGFRGDVAACLDAMDIFVLPSLAEYHSIALLEAMRAAKAIVATDVGGNTESIRHLKEGLIVPSANPKALAKAIRRLCEDRSLSDVLGKSARERFKHCFTDEIMVRNTAKFIAACGASQAGSTTLLQKMH